MPSDKIWFFSHFRQKHAGEKYSATKIHAPGLIQRCQAR